MSEERSEPLRIWWNKNLRGKITPGKLAAHAAHAALAAYGITYDHPIVVLAAGRGRIEAMPVNIHDAGHTELEPGTLTTGVEDESHLHWLAEHDAQVKAEAEAEADYWRAEHQRIVKAIDEIAWGRHDHPDGVRGALHALHYSATGARHPSQREAREIAQALRAVTTREESL